MNKFDNDIAVLRSIDITPTWKGILPALLLAYVNGNAEGRAIALGELQRMADIADAAVARENGESK